MKYFVCAECNAQFPTTGELNFHIQSKHPKKKKKARTASFQMTDGDDKLLKMIEEALGTSRGDAIRTCIRAYAVTLERLLARG